MDLTNASTAPNEKSTSTSDTYYLGAKVVSKEICDRIDSLIMQDDLDSAIDLVKEITGLSKPEAKSFVESHQVGSWKKCSTQDSSTISDTKSQGSSTKKILCIISSALIGISAVLPYVSVSFLGTTMSKSLLDVGDGYFLIGIALVGIICAIKRANILTTLAGVAALALFFLENSTISKNLDSGNEFARQMLQHGTGYYCLVIGAVALIASAVLIHSDDKQS